MVARLPGATDFGWGQIQNYRQWPAGQVLQFAPFLVRAAWTCNELLSNTHVVSKLASYKLAGGGRGGK